MPPVSTPFSSKKRFSSLIGQLSKFVCCTVAGAETEAVSWVGAADLTAVCPVSGLPGAKFLSCFAPPDSAFAANGLEATSASANISSSSSSAPPLLSAAAGAPTPALGPASAGFGSHISALRCSSRCVVVNMSVSPSAKSMSTSSVRRSNRAKSPLGACSPPAALVLSLTLFPREPAALLSLPRMRLSARVTVSPSSMCDARSALAAASCRSVTGACKQSF
mmetsp:Transcript_2183/g.5762  ORF Transcript_2183/g.5762 Transcript_2183/m.5762 type:complete len:221 (-) Transcript_2183:858-1520(-)